MQPNATVNPGHLTQKQFPNASGKSCWNLHNHIRELSPTPNQAILQQYKSLLSGGRFKIYKVNLKQNTFGALFGKKKKWK